MILSPFCHHRPYATPVLNVILFFLFLPLLSVMGVGEKEFEMFMAKMESDVLEFASEMERVYGERCSSSSPSFSSPNQTHDHCEGGSYDACTSEYPQQSCPGGDMFSVPTCGDGISCGGLFDLTITSVDLPVTISGGLDKYGNPLDDMVKETMCYSLEAESYMIQKFQNDTTYWNELGIDAPHRFFGSDEGTFRIHPARQKNECGTYDNTKRPWYVAATSGPKDVILILDTSGSMTRRGRLKLMKKAASRVVDTLTASDHVSIISFSNEAEVLIQSALMQGTKENREQLRYAIDKLEAKGSTNYLAAFSKAFDVLEESRDNEFSSLCHTAILFLTDGVMTEPEGVTSDQVIDLIETRIEELNVNPFLFLYSLGYEANRGDAADVPRKIACSTGGMWSGVEDGGDLATAMASYYKVLALGLGDDENEGFVAWVDPYEFATGGVMGTTVSAPVYDRSVVPNVLLGAVGIDFTMAAIEAALGVEAGSEEMLNRLVLRSTAVCPKLNLTECAIQSIRFAAGGEDALCRGECQDFVGITPQVCANDTIYPTNFWNNTGNKGRSYEERVCCSVGETRHEGEHTLEEIQSQRCASRDDDEEAGRSTTLSKGINPGIILVAIIAVLCGIGVYCYFPQIKQALASCRSTDVAPEGEVNGTNDIKTEDRVGNDQDGHIGSGQHVVDQTASKDDSVSKLPLAIAAVAVPLPPPGENGNANTLGHQPSVYNSYGGYVPQGHGEENQWTGNGTSVGNGPAIRPNTGYGDTNQRGGNNNGAGYYYS